MERLREPAATIRGGGFVGIINNVVGNFDTLLAECHFVPHIAKRCPNTTEFPISPAAVYRFNKAIQVYTDKRSGTNTDRSGYADLMNDLASGEIDRVVVSEVSRLSRSVRDFAEAVERIVDEHGAALHILDMGLNLDPDGRDPYTRAFLSVAATFAELEADIKRENTRQGMAAAKALGKQTGRPPFGFDVGPEGYPSPNDDFETALVILDRLDRGDSKRSVANSAGVSRRTVGRIEQRRDLYENYDD